MQNYGKRLRDKRQYQKAWCPTASDFKGKVLRNQDGKTRSHLRKSFWSVMHAWCWKLVVQKSTITMDWSKRKFSLLVSNFIIRMKRWL
jgi:hypothetical protein